MIGQRAIEVATKKSDSLQKEKNELLVLANLKLQQLITLVKVNHDSTAVPQCVNHQHYTSLITMLEEYGEKLIAKFIISVLRHTCLSCYSCDRVALHRILINKNEIFAVNIFDDKNMKRNKKKLKETNSRETDLSLSLSSNSDQLPLKTDTDEKKRKIKSPSTTKKGKRLSDSDHPSDILARKGSAKRAKKPNSQITKTTNKKAHLSSSKALAGKSLKTTKDVGLSNRQTLTNKVPNTYEGTEQQPPVPDPFLVVDVKEEPEDLHDYEDNVLELHLTEDDPIGGDEEDININDAIMIANALGNYPQETPSCTKVTWKLFFTVNLS